MQNNVLPVYAVTQRSYGKLQRNNCGVNIKTEENQTVVWLNLLDSVKKRILSLCFVHFFDEAESTESKNKCAHNKNNYR